MVLDLKNDRHKLIDLSGGDMKHYRISFDDGFSSKSLPYTGILVNEVSPGTDLRMVSMPTTYRYLFSLVRGPMPAKGKYNRVKLADTFVGPRLIVGKNQGRNAWVYGMTDLEGNELIPLKYDELKNVPKGIKATKDNKIGLFSFDGKELMPVEFTQAKYSKKYYELK